MGYILWIVFILLVMLFFFVLDKYFQFQEKHSLLQKQYYCLSLHSDRLKKEIKEFERKIDDYMYQCWDIHAE